LLKSIADVKCSPSLNAKSPLSFSKKSEVRFHSPSFKEEVPTGRMRFEKVPKADDVRGVGARYYLDFNLLTRFIV
jgi:hypothetical protein